MVYGMKGFFQVIQSMFDQLAQDDETWRLNKAAPEIAGRVRDAAQRVVYLIETRFAQKPQDGKPLYVALGETHQAPEHQLVHMLVGSALRDKGYKIAIGHERPYNRGWQKMLEMMKQAKATGNKKSLLSLQKVAGSDFGRTQMNLNNFRLLDAPYSHDLVSNSFARRGISMAFNDAARCAIHRDKPLDKYNSKLDMLDEVTRSLTAEHKIVMDDAASLMSAPGMHLRNRVMVMKACEHAARERAEIYIQLCGNAHVAGVNNIMLMEKLPYEESLTGLFRAQGDSAVGIPVFGKTLKARDMPEEALRNGSVVPGPVFTGWEFEGRDNEREHAWLKAVMKHLQPGTDIDKALTRPSYKEYKEGLCDFEILRLQRRGVLKDPVNP